MLLKFSSFDEKEFKAQLLKLRLKF